MPKSFVKIQEFISRKEKLLAYSVAFSGYVLLSVWLLINLVIPQRQAEYLSLARSNLITMDSLHQVRLINAIAQDSLGRLKSIQNAELKRLFSKKGDLITRRMSIDSTIRLLREAFSVLIKQLDQSDSLRHEYELRFGILAEDWSEDEGSKSIVIELKTGWNMIGYTKSKPIRVELAFLALGSSLIIVSDEYDRVYDPVNNINEIGSLLPGKGYLVMVSRPSGFSFP